MFRQPLYQAILYQAIFALTFGFGALGTAHSQTTPAPPAPIAPTVTVKPARDTFVFPQHEAAASVIARNESKLAAEITASIVQVNADVGATVKRGATLVRLDDADFRLALDRVMAQKEALQAKLDLAERQLARAKELREQNFISAEAVNQRESEVLNWRAEVKGLDSRPRAGKSKRP